MTRSLCLVLSLAVFLTGCKTITEENREQLAKPVDCSTAEQDIKALEDEHRSVAERTLSGVRMVLPAALVLGILGRDIGNRAEVAVGTYNDELEAKIAETREACAIPVPEAEPS